ncbi:MAG: UDP-glucose 4-epimerase GalE [Candidatus Cloacimonetes bacterium]|jgi:UDP-glucose 4-epimerase|nr:UDP-glucose 4-epimerase GalE [Candidatus Cloacimonadota bacterium]
MKILLTGGTGYIGSHVCVELLNWGHDVVIIDNLSNSKIGVIERMKKITGKNSIHFRELDLCDYESLEQVFNEFQFDAIMHFAGLKAVGESVANPLGYYENNVHGSLNLLRAMTKNNVHRIVFSSSATVYGSSEDVPFHEDSPLSAVNPYGRSKLFIEEILRDYQNANNEAMVCILRYFNPVGAHKSGLIGEDPTGVPNNLMPFIMQVAAGKQEKLSIFGSDYPTNDGTCIRDYIHVVDLAEGHVAALEKHIHDTGFFVYNLGRGQGISVLEMVYTFQRANSLKIEHKFSDRREGDIAVSYAANNRACSILNWKPERTLEDMCFDSWQWYKNSKLLISE